MGNNDQDQQEVSQTIRDRFDPEHSISGKSAQPGFDTATYLSAAEYGALAPRLHMSKFGEKN